MMVERAWQPSGTDHPQLGLCEFVTNRYRSGSVCFLHRNEFSNADEDRQSADPGQYEAIY